MKIFLLICVICYVKHPEPLYRLIGDLLSKLNEDEYGKWSVMNKQYLNSVYENKGKCVANDVLLNEWNIDYTPKP